jgi:hypothetical protein
MREQKNSSAGASQSGNPSQKGDQGVDQTESEASKHGYVHGTVLGAYHLINTLNSGQYPVSVNQGSNNSNDDLFALGKPEMATTGYFR